jgi:hypothetical protein
MENQTADGAVGENQVEKPKKERKLDNPKYFVEYYHNNNPHIICECGQSVRRMFKLKHSRLAKHKFLLEKKNEIEQKLNDLGK